MDQQFTDEYVYSECLRVGGMFVRKWPTQRLDPMEMASELWIAFRRRSTWIAEPDRLSYYLWAIMKAKGLRYRIRHPVIELPEHHFSALQRWEYCDGHATRRILIHSSVFNVIPMAGKNPEQLAIASEQSRLIKKTFRKLPLGDRALLRLLYLREKPREKIRVDLKVTQGALTARKKTALRRFREIYLDLA